MIKAIIFDCFGVLTTDAWIAFKKRHFRDNKELAQKASKLNNLAGSGELTYPEFLEKVAKLAGMSLRDVQNEINTNVSDEELFDYIKTLKPNYKIGMLSNTAANHLARLFSPEQISLFDAIVLSYEEGVIKPEVKAYELTAERLGVETTECVFIDDQEKHCEGARLAGMRAILYEDFPSFKEKLEAFLASVSDN